MDDSARNQALVTSFAFGLVVCAASGTVLFHLRGGASSLVRGGLRLVLAAFLLFVTLWAVNGFVGAFISQDDTAACQITVAFASAFDQIARVTLEEYLFWAMRRDLRATSGLWFTQTIIFLRFVLGGIFVGVHRPHFAPICVATSLVWQIGVAVAVADAAVVFILLTRASSVGLFRDAKAGGAIGLRARGLTFTTVALGLWIPLSVPMALGVNTVSIAVRSALPSVGALLIIACIVFFYKGLICSRQDLFPNTVYINELHGPADATLQSRGSLSRNPSSASNVSSVIYPDIHDIHQRSPKHIWQLVQARLPASGSSNVGSKLRGARTHQGHGQTTDTLKALPNLPVRPPPVDFTTVSHQGKSLKAAIDALVPQMLRRSPLDEDNQPYDSTETRFGNAVGNTRASSGIPRSRFVKMSVSQSGSRPQAPPIEEHSKSAHPLTQLRGIAGLQKKPSAQAREMTEGNREMQTTIVRDGVDLGDMRWLSHDQRRPDLSESVSSPSVMDRPRPVPRRSDFPARSRFQEIGKSLGDTLTHLSSKLSRGEPTVLQPAAADSSQPRPPPPTIAKSAGPVQSVTHKSTSQAQLSRPTAGHRASHAQRRPESIGSQWLPRNDLQTILHVPEVRTPLYAWCNEEAAGSSVSSFGIAAPTSSINDLSSENLQRPAVTLPPPSKAHSRSRSSPMFAIRDAKQLATPASVRADRSLVGSRNRILANRAIEVPVVSNKGLFEGDRAHPLPNHLPTWRAYDEGSLLNRKDRDGTTTMNDRSTEHSTTAASTHLSRKVCGGARGRSSSWHHRVGDNCPTFSNRNAAQVRRVVQPPPLELEKTSRRFKGPAPQIPPLETPGHALGVVEEQLKKLEESTSIPDAAEHVEPRVTLLADIEAEMGRQENRWHELRGNYSRA
ncbi:hypothetical protein E4U56_004643 [Claviceps arundinis]|uniref:Uncharacterized protein n=1 Tax=Claviceps arundinis TaxID=1623583 RepID=A0A9P7MY51_9HYPO|nr:hypothetical protein E4U56_004643 [Claviceps arundinis]